MLGDAAIDWSGFLEEWGGEYHVRLSEGSDGATVTRSFKVTAKETGIELSYSEAGSTPTTPATARQTPPVDELWYRDNKLVFELTFVSFGDSLKTFAGKIYPIDGTAPEVPNAFGAMAKAGEKWSIDLITATWIAALGTFLAIIGPIITYALAKKDADSIKDAIDKIGTADASTAKPTAPNKFISNDPSSSEEGQKDLGNAYGEKAAFELDTVKKETKKVENITRSLSQLGIQTKKTEKDLQDAQAAHLPTEAALKKQLAEEQTMVEEQTHESKRSQDRKEKADGKHQDVVEKKKNVEEKK